MCGPVGDGVKKDYTLVMKAEKVFECGHRHPAIYGHASCDKFADAFKEVRAFWSKHPKAEIEITLKISASATDHLKAAT
jgi:hypothetical protein